jgi:hypothetical protein
MAYVSDSIYLNKRGNETFTGVWVYYRLTSLGKLGDSIEVALLTWPDFKDIDVVGDIDKAVVVNPGDTGYVSAYPNFTTLLQKKWNIDHEKSVVIGIRVREKS